MRSLAFLMLLACGTTGQESVTIDGQPVLKLANDKLSLTIRKQGGAMAELLLKDDSDRVSPLHARLGHFVCVDGFGSVSPEERKAGLPGHGEANRVPWEVASSEKKNGVLTVAFSATLPIVQEIFRRTIRMVDGENVVYIDSELESLLGFDRPVNWGEHATIGPPFLELGRTTVEMSSKRGMTRSWESQTEKPHRLANLKEFVWPSAPGVDGGSIDVRTAPATPPVGDHSTSQMDPARKLVFVTAFHPDKRLLFGYVWRGKNTHGRSCGNGIRTPHRSARGLEFAYSRSICRGAMSYSRTRCLTRQHIAGCRPNQKLLQDSQCSTLARLRDLGRWMTCCSNVGTLAIEDRTAGVRIALPASRGL